MEVKWHALNYSTSCVQGDLLQSSESFTTSVSEFQFQYDLLKDVSKGTMMWRKVFFSKQNIYYKELFY